MRESVMERQLEGESRGKFMEKFFLGEIPRTAYLESLKKAGMKGAHEYKANELEEFQNWKTVLQERNPKQEELINIVKKTQPWENPKNPDNLAAKQLYSAVKEKIGAFAPKHMHWELRYYTTVNSHLDLFQGTDAIFEYYEDTGEEDLKMLAQVSVDVKTSSDRGPTILSISPDDSDKIQDLLREHKMDEAQKIIDRQIGEWSDKVAKMIEEDIKRKKRR
jgi:hypothetical protein